MPVPSSILHVFPSFVPGGAQVRLARLVEGLAQEMPGDLQHRVMSLDGRTAATDLWPTGVPLEVVPPPAPGGSIRRTLALRRILVARRPDLLLTYNWGAIDAVLAARTLCISAHVHHEDGFNTDEAANLKARRNWTRRLALGRGRRLIVPSRTLLRIARERWHLPEGAVALVPNGIATADFAPVTDGPMAPTALRQRLSIPDGAPVIGTVGHLRPVKNHARLLEAFDRLGDDLDVHLVIVGEGPQRAPLEARLATLPCASRVRLVGHQDPSAPWYGLFDLFVLASDSEQMPVALLEAMAAGLPVVCTDVGDVRDMLSEAQAPWILGGNTGGPSGEASSEASIRMLGDAMAALLAREDLRTELGAANRERVRRDYGHAAMVTAYARIYGEALSGLGSGPAGS